MKPDEVREEVFRLEQERRRLAPEVMGGDPAALEEDTRLERRIMELARAEEGGRPDKAIDPGRRDNPGGTP